MQSRISLARLHIHLVLTFKKYELLDMLIPFFRRVLRACVVLFPLLGVTWVFGVLSVTDPTGIVFQYFFTICNSLQVIFGFWPWLNLYQGCINYKFRVKRCTGFACLPLKNNNSLFTVQYVELPLQTIMSRTRLVFMLQTYKFPLKRCYERTARIVNKKHCTQALTRGMTWKTVMYAKGKL